MRDRVPQLVMGRKLNARNVSPEDAIIVGKVIIFFAAFFAIIPIASANLIPYVIQFTTTTVYISPYCADERAQGYKEVPCDTEVGDNFFGIFTVEEALLATDGINLPGTLGDFVIVIGDYVWNMNDSGSDFVGFVGPTLPTGETTAGATSPGFDVVGGRIVDIRGGVFGAFDFPFVDFTSPFSGANTWAAGAGSNYFFGRFDIFALAVDEPASVMLAFWWIAFLCLVARHHRIRLKG